MAGISERLAFLVTLDGDQAVKGFEKIGAAADKSLGKSDQRIQKASLNLQSFGAKALAVGGLAVAGLTSAANAAGDLQESIASASVIFGDAADEVLKFGETAADTIGQSNRAALEAASTFGTFGKAAGLTGRDLSGFSLDLVKLSSDLASFKNTTPEEAVEALGAALRGESEPIRKYGVLLDEATLKQRALDLGLIETTKGTLPPAIKVQAAYAEILAQTGDAQGDFARTSDGLANSQRTAAARFEDAKAALGQGFLPILTAVTEKAGDLAAMFSALNTSTGGLASKVVAFGVVGLGAAGAVSYLAGKVLGAVDTFRKLGSSFVTTEGAVTRLGKVLGGVGIAITAAGLVYEAYSSNKRKAEQATNEFAEALQAEAEGQNDALDALIAKRLQEGNSLDTAKALGLSARDLTRVIMGEQIPAFEAAKRRFDELNGAYQSGNTAARNYEKETGVSAEATYNLLEAIGFLAPAYSNGVKQQQRSAQVQSEVTEAVDGTRQMYLEYQAALTSSTGATQTAATATGDLANALDPASRMYVEFAEGAKDAYDNVTDFNAATSKAVSVIGALRGAIENDQAWFQLEQVMIDLKEANEEAWTAAAEGADDAADKARNATSSSFQAKLELLDMLETLGSIPTDVRSQITTAIETGDLQRAYDLMKFLKEQDGKTYTTTQRVLTPRYGYSAMGGNASGLRMVGERGPELVNLPIGSSVTSNPQLRADLSGAGGGSVRPVYVTINMPPGSDGDDVVRAIRDYERINGTGWRD